MQPTILSVDSLNLLTVFQRNQRIIEFQLKINQRIKLNQRIIEFQQNQYFSFNENESTNKYFQRKHIFFGAQSGADFSIGIYLTHQFKSNRNVQYHRGNISTATTQILQRYKNDTLEVFL